MNPGFRDDELKVLAQGSEAPCVSIFMPTHRSGPETQQDPIRLTNLLRTAEEQLVDLGLRAPEARNLLKEASGLAKDGFFWRHQADGLAIFASPQFFRTYRVPIHFNELVVVTDRFHLKPLLRLFSVDGRFYLLTLSLKEVRLFECTHYGLNEIKLEDIPKGIDEALKYDHPAEKERFHTRVTGTIGKGDAIFRGHGTGVDDTKTGILRYFQKVADGLHRVIGGDNVPLLLAGVDYLLPLFRQANIYPNILDSGITGNPDGMKPTQVHEMAWALIKPYFLQVQEKAASRYRELAGTPLASGDIREVVPASYFGRVDSIFVPSGIRKWGTFDPNSRELHIFNGNRQPGSQDLLDLAAIQTYLHGGSVFTVEPEGIPGAGVLAATYRY